MTIHKEVIIGNARLLLGDCADILPTLSKVDAVITDPPYGMDWAFTGQGSGKAGQGGSNSITKGKRIQGDAVEFDPTHLLAYGKVIVWGMQHYPHKLARGSVLVWIKKYQDAFGTFLSDADLAWMRGGCGVYCSRTINPASFQAEKCHPTQKPVELMAWCIEMAKVEPGQTVLDPYMGSGTTGVASIQMGRNFIGIERDPEYFEFSCQRIAKAHAQGQLFDPDPIQQIQEVLL